MVEIEEFFPNMSDLNKIRRGHRHGELETTVQQQACQC
jgi:hypothetical protein